MAAAYELRGHDIYVLEAEERVGGRTLTYGDDHAWANLGAQVVTSGGSREFADELGLDLIDISEAHVGIGINGELKRASRAELLALRLPLPAADRVALVRAVLRLRRTLRKVQTAPGNADEKSLQDLIGRVRPSVQEILSRFTVISTALDPSEISGLIGLGYSLETYLNPKAHSQAAVRGGSQRISQAIEAGLEPGRVRVGARVVSVDQDDSRVVVRYVQRGEQRELRGRECICALPAPRVLDVVPAVSDEKRAALEAMCPYNRVMSVAWPLSTERHGPWHGLAMVPLVGDAFAFNLLVNHAYYVAPERRSGAAPGGYLVLLSSRGVPNAPLDVPDSAALERGLADLALMFPDVLDYVDLQGGRVQRWIGLPPFSPGFLQRRPALRQPTGRIRYCGDYTAEPGLSGAVRSGRAVGRALAEDLITSRLAL